MGIKETKFDLAILFHWFWNGISIPEHYMEDIRRLSPDTFVAVLTDDQQGLREMQLANLTHYWADCERSGDFASREMEVYRRADVVLTISEDDRQAFLRGFNRRILVDAERVQRGGVLFESLLAHFASRKD